MSLTQARLKELLSYDPEMGVFVWVARSGCSNISVGDRAGWEDGGYIRIEVDGGAYRAHRLAFLYMTGEMPKGHFDHLNNARSDNRWTNLRDATRSINAQNQTRAHKNNKSCGLLGVSRHADGKWVAKVRLGGAEHYGGLHATPEAAHAKYLEMKRALHPGCTL